MLNPAFSKELAASCPPGYKLPGALIREVKARNCQTNSGAELRLQEVYGREIWRKIVALRLHRMDWSTKAVLDVSCGRGFLSYHLLKRIRPQLLTLVDISAAEVAGAKHLISGSYTDVTVKYLVADAMESGLSDGIFDVIIGNSFLHHFYDLTAALAEFRRLLRPRGLFVTLHEPMTAALALESGSVHGFLSYLIRGQEYFDRFRYSGSGIAEGGGEDVWIFQPHDIRKLSEAAGFVNVKEHYWHFLRPLLVAKLNMHLGQNKPMLSGIESSVIEVSSVTDFVLSSVLPASWFGSIALVAEAP